MICPICRSTEPNWKPIDELRAKPEGMHICMNDGFVSYPGRYKAKAEILKYYEEEYRNPPSVGNLYTSERKLQFHAAFLKDVLPEFKDRQDMVITDIGSAFGVFLSWIRGVFPKADLYGVELTKSFVRNAWHLYNIETKKDFDDTKKHDLIASYKSLEHILDPDFELRRYLMALKDGGYLYISVPLWFHSMKNFGSVGWDIEYYYSPNHINSWTKKHFEGLLKIAGAEIVKENHTMYDSTYLVRRNDAIIPADRSVAFEDPARIMGEMKKIFDANEAYTLGDYAKAVALYPNFPYGWANLYEHSRAALDKLGIEKIYNEFCVKALSACPDEADVHFMTADICARYDDYIKAIEHLNYANQLRPNQPNILALMSSCFRVLAKRAKSVEDKLKLQNQAKKIAEILRDTSRQHYGEATTWIMWDNAQMPTPFEVNDAK